MRVGVMMAITGPPPQYVTAPSPTFRVRCVPYGARARRTAGLAYIRLSAHRRYLCPGTHPRFPPQRYTQPLPGPVWLEREHAPRVGSGASRLSKAKSTRVGCRASRSGRAWRQSVTPGTAIVSTPLNAVATSAFNSPSVRRTGASREKACRGTCTGAPGPGPSCLARAEVRILGACSCGVSTHLQGHNAVVDVAHRDQEPWGAGQRPPAPRTLGIDPESRHPCAGVGTTAVD